MRKIPLPWKVKKETARTSLPANSIISGFQPFKGVRLPIESITFEFFDPVSINTVQLRFPTSQLILNQTNQDTSFS
jgi:hypothetical protein